MIPPMAFSIGISTGGVERGYIATCLESEKVANKVDMYLKGWRVNTITEVIRGQKLWGMFAKAQSHCSVCCPR